MFFVYDEVCVKSLLFETYQSFLWQYYQNQIDIPAGCVVYITEISDHYLSLETFSFETRKNKLEMNNWYKNEESFVLCNTFLSELGTSE